MTKVDFKQEFKEFYLAKVDKPVTVNVPKMNYLMIDGKGDPNTSQEYIDAIQTLYPVAYTIKFACKKAIDIDYGVMPLEGLWWAPDMKDFTEDNKDNWFWTAMIMQPPCVKKEIFENAVKEVARKKNPKSLDKIRFESYTEGRAAQVMYVGPYSAEGPTILKLHDYIASRGGELTEKTKHHHEIYLGDPRRTDPSKLKTIIRQPY